jgi:hypothetical protein
VAQSWRTSRPRILSLRGADVRDLVLSSVDLRACRFIGAHNLDQLRLEAIIDLAQPPADLRSGWLVPPVWRWTRRRTIAEEHRWRCTQAKHAGWYPRSCRMRHLGRQEQSLRPADIAPLYRALRKGREDSGDQPAAADLYYGEMETRRHDWTTSSSQRILLWLYWLAAGYGLRASRALVCLFGVLIVATALLITVGFARVGPLNRGTSEGFTGTITGTITGLPPQQRIQFYIPPPRQPPTAPTFERSFGAQLNTAVRTVVSSVALVSQEGVSLFPDDPPLTPAGTVIQATLRVVGPVLLILVFVSIRERVKR